MQPLTPRPPVTPRPVLALAAAPLAALAFSLATGPAAAATLGHMTLRLGGHPIAYRLSDSPGAASGWEVGPRGVRVAITWRGAEPTDTMVMDLAVEDGHVRTARLSLPEAARGPMAAAAPARLTLILREFRREGAWLHLSGRLRGRLTPSTATGADLGATGEAVSGRFSTWVPEIVTATAGE